MAGNAFPHPVSGVSLASVAASLAFAFTSADIQLPSWRLLLTVSLTGFVGIGGLWQAMRH